MRRLSAILLATGLLAAFAPAVAYAQLGGGRSGGRGGGGGDEQDDRKKSRLDREMQTQALPLPPVTADGPCPYVKVLYDAARQVEFKEAGQSAGNVAWSAEMEGLIADCQYKNDEPIKVQANVTFRFGRGPQATGAKKAFTYWVAVTDRNRAVLGKEYFTVNVDFPQGQDRVLKIEQVQQIVIPRKAKTVSGENFEVLIGFDLTPQQVAFNRSGARFRVNATGDITKTAPTQAATTR